MAKIAKNAIVRGYLHLHVRRIGSILPSCLPYGKPGGLQILRYQGIAVAYYGFTPDALPLKPSDFCNVGVYSLMQLRRFRKVEHHVKLMNTSISFFVLESLWKTNRFYPKSI
jgi:hypothetical protein